jgi:plasmid replication initiation protein
MCYTSLTFEIRTALMNTNNLIVYKSNAIIQAAYQLTLNEQRVVLASIGKVDPRKELLDTDRFELSAKDFVAMFEVSEKNAYKALIEVTERLFNRYVTIDRPFPDKPRITKLKTRWISSICYMETEGKVALRFAPDLIPYLNQLKGDFTRYELKHIGNMTSTYGVRLYELLMQWKSTGKREIEIAWLKKQFELENKYASIKDLKLKVIDPAVKDINSHSNFSVQWEQRKTGRSVTHLTFTFAEKKQPETEAKPADAEPKPQATITLTEEQQKCFEWAKNQPYWQRFTKNKNSFLTCFNKAVEGGLKDQWLATLPQTAKPKKEKTAEALKKETELSKVHLKNELASLKNLYKLSPNDALAAQILNLEEKIKTAK